MPDQEQWKKLCLFFSPLGLKLWLTALTRSYCKLSVNSSGYEYSWYFGYLEVNRKPIYLLQPSFGNSRSQNSTFLWGIRIRNSSKWHSHHTGLCKIKISKIIFCRDIFPGNLFCVFLPTTPLSSLQREVCWGLLRFETCYTRISIRVSPYLHLRCFLLETHYIPGLFFLSWSWAPMSHRPNW